MKQKIIIIISILLVPCTSFAADSPFREGKVYLAHDVVSNTTFRLQVKDVKGKWIFVKSKQACRDVADTNECWVNTDKFWFTSAVD